MSSNFAHSPAPGIPSASNDAGLRLNEEFSVPATADWRKLAEQDLDGKDFEKRLVWQADGFSVQPLYTHKDLEGLKHLGSLPGAPPWVRGGRPAGHAGPAWEIRQDCLLATPEDVNRALRDGLAKGATSVCIRLDNAVRRGLDGDEDAAAEFAGRGGCTLTSLNGLRTALEGIDLAAQPVTIRTGTSALPVLAMMVALADEREVPRKALRGGVECDPVRDMVKFGRSRGSTDMLFDEMAAMARFCAQECPEFRPVIVNSHPYHNAGAAEAQELGCLVGTAALYMRQMIERGLSPSTAARAISFSVSSGSNLFFEIAKFRAARLLWAKVAKAFGAGDEAGRMVLHARTSSHTQSVVDPYNNMLRAAFEAFAAAAGGCDSLYMAPFDECMGRPDDFSMRIARNQQLILMAEAHLGHVTDVAGGSYYVESLTHQIGHQAWKFFQRIEGRGGMLKALGEGSLQEAIATEAEKRRWAINARRQPIVGVSTYADPAEKLMEKPHIPRGEFLEERKSKVEGLKRERYTPLSEDGLHAITAAARSHGNRLVEATVEAVKAGATIHEVLESVGAGNQSSNLPIQFLSFDRAAEPFEQLRQRAQAMAASTGKQSVAMLVMMGPAAMRRARAGFSAGFVAAGGFVPVESGPFDEVDSAVQAICEACPTLVVLCSDDPSYATIAPPLIAKLRQRQCASLVMVAGYPQDDIAALLAAGVHGFIHIKSDAIQTLGEMQDALGFPKAARAVKEFRS